MNSSPLTPEIVSQIAKQASGKLDLREFQGELYRIQRAKRLVNREAGLRKSATRRFRSRVRLPLLPQCKVLDTRTDSRGKLYFELENGQAIRADHVVPHFRKSGNRAGYVPLAKIQNPVIQQLVTAEIERNAARKAA